MAGGYDIALQARGPNVMMPAEVIGRVEDARNAQMRNAMIQDEARQQRALDESYRQSGGDINAMLQNPDIGFGAGMKLRQMKAEQQQMDIEAQKQMFEMGSAILAGANDQQGWDAAISEFGRVVGAEAAARLPKEFNPQVRDQLVMAGMSAKDRIALAKEERMREDQRADREWEERKFYEREARADARAAMRASGGDGGDNSLRAPSGYRFNEDGSLSAIPGGPADKPAESSPQGKPLSSAEIKLENEIRSATAKAVDVGDKINVHLENLKNGTLKPSAWNTAKTKAAAAGVPMVGDEQTDAMASLMQDAAEARDAILAMNAGVQTDGDAERAYQRVLTSKNDKDMLKTALEKLRSVQEKAIAQKQLEGEAIRQNKGLEIVDYAGQYRSRTGAPKQPSGGGKVMTKEQLQKAADAKFGGNVDAAMKEAIARGYYVR